VRSYTYISKGMTKNKTEKVHLISAIKILRDLFWLGENEKAISFCMELPRRH